MTRINYVELPVGNVGVAKTFYEAAFGWQLVDFGPSYAATMTGDVDLGLQGDPVEATRAPLPVIEVTALETWPDRIEAAGGRVVRPIFAFPGGRRLQFVDPAGNELALMQGDP